MTSGEQASAWSFGFYGFALVCGYLAIEPVLRANAGGRESFRGEVEGNRRFPSRNDSRPLERVRWLRRAAWVLLPALASMMLLATTNHVCQDIAVVPFLWIVPLSLYLLSFIICFDSPRWYRRGPFAVATAAGVLGVSAMMYWNDLDSLLRQVTVNFATLFVVCMLCHGELVRLKPAPSRLTDFYLSVSAGGALGGILVAVVCPLVFSTYAEMNLGLILSFALAIGVLMSRQPWPWGVRVWLAVSVVCVGMGAVAYVQVDEMIPRSLATVRNFYGVLHVLYTVEDGEDQRELVHGRISHGCQLLAEEDRHVPTSYYNVKSGVGVAIKRLPFCRSKEGPMRVGAIGLGAGTIAAYCRRGDHYRFYEINPIVPKIASEYFTFLRDAPGEVEFVLGDARLSMEREADQQYDVIVLDAFSGDAIPSHLITTQAFEVYRRHLSPEGVIAAHVSNKHLDLRPLLAAIAQRFGWQTTAIEYDPDEDDHPRPPKAASASDWVLLTTNRKFLADPFVKLAPGGPLEDYHNPPLWTDDYSNLLELLD
jgi:hypothetical protein